MSEETKKPKLVRGVTPKGIAVWPHLNTPDEYKGVKSYKTGLLLEADDAANLIAKITEATEKSLADTREALENQAKAGKTGQAKAKARKALEELTVGYPYEDAVDDDGEPTGKTMFKFKAKAEFEDKKTRTTKPITIPIFDAKGKTTHVAIWGGSEIRVAYALVPYYVASANVCGVSLRIEGVKVINPVTGGAGRSADSLGFGEEEEGYEADEMGEPESDAMGDDPDHIPDF